jgi:hypothetical protein
MPRNRVIPLLLIWIVFLFPVGVSSGAAQARHYQTEQQAKQSCPNDIVVWVNGKTGVYHFKGQRWYGRTKEGWYECRKEADGEGDRATRNGQ